MSVKEYIVDYIRSGETTAQNLGLEVEHTYVYDEEQMNMLLMGYAML